MCDDRGSLQRQEVRHTTRCGTAWMQRYVCDRTHITPPSHISSRRSSFSIEVERPDASRGVMQMERVPLDIQIRAGMADGAQFRVRGTPQKSGVIITLRQKPHARYAASNAPQVVKVSRKRPPLCAPCERGMSHCTCVAEGNSGSYGWEGCVGMPGGTSAQPKLRSRAWPRCAAASSDPATISSCSTSSRSMRCAQWWYCRVRCYSQ